jgi:hypothetical protein
MPNLIQSLQGRDVGYLRIVARFWGIELVATEIDSLQKELAAGMLNPGLVSEVISSLNRDAQSALSALTKANGRLPWAAFSRSFGEIRDAGPGRRDREQIYLHPDSTAEVLYYRALLARAFYDLPSGAQEFAYIPDDLFHLLPSEGLSGLGGNKKISFSSDDNAKPLGRPALPKEREHPLHASDRLLDDATTILAALRMGIRPSQTCTPVRVVKEFLSAARIIVDEEPQIEPVRIFLEKSRQVALEQLVSAWQESGTFDELRQVPGIICEGEWSNQPVVTRGFLMALLESLPKGTWWSLPAFIRSIKDKYPDFQRPAGDYDSWFIKRESDQTYLRGFGVWDEVDGALIHYFIVGPLFWLGQVELATPAGKDIISAFRLVNDRSQIFGSEVGRLHVSSLGKITIPRSLPRAVRYQIARFCEWDEEKPDEYRYRITTASLINAREQGLKVGQLLSLLAKNASAEIPPSLVKALKRWELNGTEARMETQTVLHLSKPDMIDELRKSRTGRFLGETLGPVTVVVKPGAQSKVLAALVELGLLAENNSKNEHGEAN